MAAIVLRSVPSDTEKPLSAATTASRRWSISWLSNCSRIAGVSIMAGSN
ncbi:Uncharacterised protein [Bordetella pertussis]|nr:Uncharacterised protein [Bordetella pertussis]CFU06973.1 Uncharacterised protein [Bordetella pertussis]CPO78423.1 Uncharacterised protein [Bordetella pertussis]